MQKHVILLDGRAVIAVTGRDRQKFLQGLVTQDVAGAAPDRAIYAALLTPQGKFLHDLFLIETGAALWLDCEAARQDDLLQRLNKYKLRSDVEIGVLPDMGVGVSFAEPAEPGAARAQDGGFAYGDPRLPELGTRMMLSRAALPSRDDAALLDYDKHCMRLGVPNGSQIMIPGESILLEYNLEQLNAISFSKGCYVGQELTARTYHRALIKKRLFPVRIDGPCPAPGTAITADGQDAGVLRRARDDIGLAVLKIEAVRAGAAMRCGDASITAMPPHWLKF